MYCGNGGSSAATNEWLSNLTWTCREMWQGFAGTWILITFCIKKNLFKGKILLWEYQGILIVHLTNVILQSEGKCKNKGDGGRTIHCLMSLAYQSTLASGKGCEEELKILLKESNPLESTDWRLDPVLQRSCQVGNDSP